MITIQVSLGIRWEIRTLPVRSRNMVPDEEFTRSPSITVDSEAGTVCKSKTTRTFQEELLIETRSEHSEYWGICVDK